MYSTAALILADAHIRDLVADANRERLADLARQVSKPQPARRSWADRLGLDACRREPNPGQCVTSPG
jgi:hypothetical protein